MADPRPHYNPTDLDRAHVRGMAALSAALLHRLQTQHPRIVAHLQRNAQANRKELEP